jgi:hypothetical protein
VVIGRRSPGRQSLLSLLTSGKNQDFTLASVSDLSFDASSASSPGIAHFTSVEIKIRPEYSSQFRSRSGSYLIFFLVF